MKRRGRPAINVTSLTVTSPTTFRVEGVPQDKDAEFRRVADEIDRRPTTTGIPDAGGAYDFTMRPNIANQMREQTVTQAQRDHRSPGQRAGRDRAEHLARTATAGDQLLVQLPGVSDVGARQGDHPLDRAAAAEAGRGRAGVVAGGRCCRQYGGKVPDDMEVVSGAAGGDEAGHVVLSGEEDRADHRPGSAERARHARRERPAGRRLLADPRRGRQVRQADRRQHRPDRSPIILDNRVQTAPRDRGRGSTRKGGSPAALPGRRSWTTSLMLNSGALPASMSYLEERVIGPTLGADSIRSGVTASLAGLVLVILFMLVYYKLSGINAVVAMICNLVILLGLMAYCGAVDDAAGHRRLHPHDGHGRRLERADLRAHQGGAGGAGAALARRSTRASPACS